MRIMKNKNLLILFSFLFLSFNSVAQYYQVTHTSGTQNVSGTNVTVTSSGTGAQVYSNWCGAGPYWVGASNWQGSYTYTFGTAVTGVRFQITATNTGEVISFYINGNFYTLDNCNLSPYTGTCGSSVMSISNGTLITTTNVGNGANAQIDICGNINSVTIDCNANPGNGSVFNMLFTTGTCTLSGGTGGSVTAGANTPSCGGTLNLTATTVSGALSYSWTGPNGFTSSSQNPTITNVTGLQAGTYTVTVVTPCGTLTSSVVVTINTPSAPTVTTPVNYCQGQSASALQAVGQNLLWYTTSTGGTGSSTAPIPSTATVGTFTWWVSQTVNGCESVRTPVVVNVLAVPAAPTLGSNSPLCAGQTLNLTSNIYVGGQYSWTGPNGFTSTFQNPSIGNAQLINSGTYYLTVNVGGCTSQPSNITVVVSPLPTLTGASAQNPTTCGGTNGQLTLNGLIANTTYTVTYTLNGVPQTAVTLTANNFGQLIVTGLGAGTYTNIMASVGTCNSNTLGPITLTGPTPPNINVTVTASNNCNNPNGSLTISGLNAGSYIVNYSINGNPIAPQTLTSSGGQIVITGLAPGTYSGITVTNPTTNCTSNIAGPITIGGPVAPNITLTPTSPTTCGGNNGSIAINGVTNGSSYTINYDKNGSPQTAITQIASGGTVIINGLSAGVYSNITVTIQGCISNIAGPITITDPSAPVVTASSNSAICAGQALNLTSTSSLLNSTFSWTGPNGFTSTQQNPTINNATTAATGTYTVVVSAGSCSTTMTTQVTVNPSPSIQSGGSNSPVCQGNSLNLTAITTATGTLVWDWTGPGAYTSALQNPTIAGAMPANSGVYNVTVTANGCTSVPFPVNATVVATPAVQYTSINPGACGSATGSITLTGLNTGSSYTISYDKNGTPQTAVTQTATNNAVIINNLTAGSYSNITVSLNGCPSNIIGPVLLSDPSQPPTPVVSTGGPYCEGDNVQITVNNITGAQWNWSGPGGFSGSVQNPAINNIQINQGGTYTVVATVNGCSSLPASTQVVVNAIPQTPAITTNSPVCAGATLTMSANTIAGVTYSWSGPNSFSSPNQGETIANAQPVMNGLYTVTVSNGTCTSNQSVNITVNPIPLAPIVVSPMEMCQFDTVQLTAQGQNLLWYTQPTGGNGMPSVTPPSNSATLMMYYVSQTVNGCESPRAPMSVVVKPQPSAPVAQSGYTYCQYDTGATQLTATGSNLQWYDQATGGAPLAGAPTPNTAIPGVFHYYVSQTDSSCESNRTDVTVTIYAKPDLPTVEQITLCQDDASIPVNVQGQNTLWYTSATGGTGSPTAPVINTADTGVTDYYVSQTINGCEGDRALLRVTINPKVTASLSVSSDKACVGKPITVTFTGQAPGTANFNWNFAGASSVTGTGAGPYDVEWTIAGNKTITVTVTNLNCSATASMVIDVDPTPSAHFDIQEHACQNETVIVEADHDPIYNPSFTWDFGDAQVHEGTGYGPYRLKWSTEGQKEVTLTLTGINCPSEPYTDMINIHHPLAKIEQASHTTDICTGDSVLFTAKPGLDYKYEWSPVVSFAGEQSKGLSAWGQVKQNGYITLTVYDRWGCPATDSMLMTTKSCCEVFLPNAFTPNADGSNDIFRIVTKGHQQIKVFMIVDRWGKIIFETANQYEGWDGSYHGEAVDLGNYQYYLKYVCEDSKETVEMKGDVMLIR